MTQLEYLKEKAESTRELEDGKFTIYTLKEGVAVYNNTTNKYLWYTDPQPR